MEATGIYSFMPPSMTVTVPIFTKFMPLDNFCKNIYTELNMSWTDAWSSPTKMLFFLNFKKNA